jgi:hypothetical protein
MVRRGWSLTCAIWGGRFQAPKGRKERLMAKITVPRAQITELLGLPSDVDDETLNREMEKAIARVGATAVSAAEQRARAEDRRIVIAAVNDGRLTKSRIEFWCEALQKDRTGNWEVLASLAPGLPPAEKIVADEEVERAHNKVLARLGIKPPPRAKSPRTVEGSGQAPDRGLMLDSVGLPIPGVPAPVTISRGKDPSTWTPQQRSDYFMHRLGGKFTLGVNRPPRADDVIYQPSPDDPYEWIGDGDGQGEWRPKDYSKEARRVD